jgi:uncharacterized protein (TIGR02466 family)
LEIQVLHRDLFATRLWQFGMRDLLPLHAGGVQQIQTWRAQSPSPAGRSNRLGWNGDETVFADPAFAPLQAACQGAFQRAFADMQLTQPLRFRLNAWVNLHDPGGFNTLHMHPNVLLSGSYYLAVPEGAGALIFRDPRPGVVLNPFPGRGVHCQPNIEIRPQAGQLLVFPHWLEHRVEPNAGDTPRITVAMNAVAV